MTGAEVETIPDAMGGPSFTQNVNAPGPARTTLANGAQVLDYNGTQGLVAASVNPAWQNADWFGLAFWFKPSQEAIVGDFFSYYGGATGIAANRINCRMTFPGSVVRLAQIVRDTADTGNRQNESGDAPQRAIKPGIWQFMSWQWNALGATEAERNVMLLNTCPFVPSGTSVYSNIAGTPGGAFTQLRTATAAPNLVTLGCRDIDQGTSALTAGIRGQLGPDVFFYNPQVVDPQKLRRLATWNVPRG